MGRIRYPCRNHFLILASLIGFIGFPILAFAQAGTSEVRGFVTDESGIQLPGASVAIRNVDTGIQSSVTTDNNGYYRIASVAPGNYEIIASLSGFSTQLQSGYVFEVGSVNSIDLKMTLTGVKETITVVDETPLIERTESEIKTVVTQRQLQSIPLNGRDFQELSVLAPGTKAANALGGISVGSSSAGQGNNIMIDGGEDNYDLIGGTLQGLSVDAIQEFEVITSRFKAEFGKAGGAVINAVTKSGTNEFHGNVFEFFRDDRLTARTQPQKDQDLEKPDYNRHMFGTSLGGPILKDKTHFFLNYERLNEDANTTLSAGPAQPVFEAMGEEFGTLLQPFNRDFFTAKLNHQMNSDHSFSFRYALENGKREGIACCNSAKSNANINERQSHSFLAKHTYLVSSHALNEFLFQYTHLNDTFVGAEQADFDTPGSPRLEFPSAIMGQNFDAPQKNIQEHFQFKNDFSYNWAKHDLKTGFDIVYVPRFFTDWRANSSGVFFFREDPTVPGVLPPAFLFDIAYGESIIDRPNTQVGIYVQDDWRLLQRLTLNLGLRYDIEIGTLSNVVFDEKILYLLTGHPNAICSGCRLTDDRNNIAPRLGFAYDTKGNGSTVIRGGWGIYYDQTILLATWVNDINKYRRLITVPFPSFGPENIPPLDELLATYGSGSIPIAISPQWQFPSVQQASVGLSRKLSENIALDVDFLYSRGRNLMKWTNPNEFQIPSDPTSRRWYPELQENLALTQSIGKDEYKGLQVALRKRFSGRLQMEGHYTLGKVEGNSDWVSYEFFDSYKDIGGNTDVGPVRNDVRHRFVLSSILELPAQFQFSALVQAESARPVTAYTYADVNGNGNVPEFTTGPNGEPPGRGNFRGDPTYWVDIRFTKAIPIGERRLELMFEIFNLFNVVNYGPIYNDVIQSPRFGEPFGALFTPQFEAQLGIRFTF